MRLELSRLNISEYRRLLGAFDGQEMHTYYMIVGESYCHMVYTYGI